MGLIDSAYEIPRNMEKRLTFWLNMDAWGIDEASPILAGIDPEQTIKPRNLGEGGRILGAVTLFNGHRIPEPPPESNLRFVYDEDGNPGLVEEDQIDDIDDDARYEYEEYESKVLEAYFKKCADISRLFNNPSTLPTSPKEWIERALSKSIEIPWLKWATEHNLLPDGLKGKILAVADDGLIRLAEKPTIERKVETPQERRERLRARVQEEKAKGTKAFQKTVAKEEGISLSRLKELLNGDADNVKEAPNNWAGLAIK